MIILRTSRHLIGRLDWRHVILNLAGNSFDCRSCTACNMMCELAITSIDKSKDFTWKNLATVCADDQNGPGLWELPNKMVLTTINCNCNCGHC